MCIACNEPEIVARAERVTAADLERGRELLNEIYARELATGELVRCKCGIAYRPAYCEEAITRRGQCCSCETNWLEAEVLGPLVERLGRRAARAALLRLARGDD
jgi:hypothetical protein